MEVEKRTQQTDMSEGRSHLAFSEEREWTGVGLEATDGQVSMNVNNSIVVNLKRDIF